MSLLLAVDTSGKNASLALAEITADQSKIDVLEVVPLAGGAFSAQLVPQVAALLDRHRRSKNDLAAFVVATGPGSFTGLRVGLAAVTAFADALQKPIAALSSLEVVACSGPNRGSTIAALDAGRGDVYVGEYLLEPHVLMKSERLLSREAFLCHATAAAGDGFTVVTPDSALAELLRSAGVPFEQIEPPNSGTVARLGWHHLQRRQIVRPEELEANYIRRSDAEIFSKPTP